MTLTGHQYEIMAGPYAATVTEQGASLRRLVCGEDPLILSHDADELAPAALGQQLAPWPNRVDRGRYTYGGTAHQLEITEKELDTAIHGLVRWTPWTVTEHDHHRVVLTFRLLGQPGYPFRLDLAVECALDPKTGLTVRYSACNVGTRQAPYGYGTHPYLTVGRPTDECRVSLPCDGYLPVDERAIPTGPPKDVTGTPYDFREPRLLAGTRIDNAYAVTHRDAEGRAWARLSHADRTVSLWADGSHPWLEVYTADALPLGLRRMGLAVEPMTCPPNAFVTGQDVIDIKPGHTVTGSWGIMAG